MNENEQYVYDSLLKLLNNNAKLNELKRTLSELKMLFGVKVFDNPEIIDLLSTFVASYMRKHKVDISYSEYIYKELFNEYDDTSIHMYDDTSVERINVDDIKVSNKDMANADAYIRRGIEYSAYAIGLQMANGRFKKGPITTDFLEQMAKPGFNPDGDNIDGKTIGEFIKALIEELTAIYESRDLSKKECVEVIGAKKFKETQGKKYVENEIGYYLCSIDNDCDTAIKNALEKVGLDGIFLKGAKKTIYSVIGENAVYHSMNANNNINHIIGNTGSDEPLEKYKESIIGRISLTLTSEEKLELREILKSKNESKKK